MQICSRCLQPDTRPKIYFENGICGACLWEDQKKIVDWDKRLKQLHEIADWAKENSETYDCAIGVSGGKDSTFQAIKAKEDLGLRCLLVNCEPDDLTDLGKQNIENLKKHGFDVITLRPNPKITKKLIKNDFLQIRQSCKTY